MQGTIRASLLIGSDRLARGRSQPQRAAATNTARAFGLTVSPGTAPMLRPVDREEDRCGAARVRPPDDGEGRELVLTRGAELRIDGLEELIDGLDLPIDGLEGLIDGLDLPIVGAALRVLVGCLRETFCRLVTLGA